MSLPGKKPNFFIVGAPKSGTTALYMYLGRHRAVFMPQRKEPHYFAPDLESKRYVNDCDKYLALFAQAGNRPRVGEASVYYLYSDRSAQLIQQFAPQARIIMLLRNPVDMIHSLHSQRLFSGHEDIADFEEAIHAEADRKRGLRIPRNADPLKILFYTEVGKYADQVTRYLGVFPGEQVLPIVYDDFAADPRACYFRVCEFLGIPPQTGVAFTVHNQNKNVRSERLRALLKFTPSVKRAARYVLPRLPRQMVAQTLVRLNTRYEPRAEMSAEMRRYLQDLYADDIGRLSEILSRDLSGWTRCESVHNAAS